MGGWDDDILVAFRRVFEYLILVPVLATVSESSSMICGTGIPLYWLGKLAQELLGCPQDAILL